MELVGVVYHAGSSLKSGHYVCAVRDPVGEFWLYDDDRDQYVWRAVEAINDPFRDAGGHGRCFPWLLVCAVSVNWTSGSKRQREAWVADGA